MRTRTLRTMCWLLLGLGALAQAGREEDDLDDPRPGRRRDEPSKKEKAAPVDVEVRASAEGGAFSGLSVRRDSGGQAVASASAQMRLQQQGWRLSVPLRASHRQTFLASLSETRGRLNPEVQWKLGDLRLAMEALAAGTYRPRWPDLYQPAGAPGAYLPTDRYSHLDLGAGARAWLQPLEHHHARVDYGISYVNYADDPLFDPGAITHLTPADHVSHEVDLSWRYREGPLSLAARLDAGLRNGLVAPARQALTGGVAPGGRKESLALLEPGVEAELELWGERVEVRARYGFELQQDLYQGYYSYTGHNPRLRLRFQPLEPLAISLESELWFRTYGPSSYAAGPNHPPLLYGSRLTDRRYGAELGASYQLLRGLNLTARLSWVSRRTNYPSYEPGVFPSTRQYSIVWSYDNYAASAGLSYQLPL